MGGGRFGWKSIVLIAPTGGRDDDGIAVAGGPVGQRDPRPALVLDSRHRGREVNGTSEVCGDRLVESAHSIRELELQCLLIEQKQAMIGQ